MIIHKEKIEGLNVPFYASIDIVQFGLDGHNDLSIWFIPNELRAEYMVVGTGCEFDDCWVPMKMLGKSKGGFIWHLLKRR